MGDGDALQARSSSPLDPDARGRYREPDGVLLRAVNGNKHGGIPHRPERGRTHRCSGPPYKGVPGIVALSLFVFHRCPDWDRLPCPVDERPLPALRQSSLMEAAATAQ